MNTKFTVEDNPNQMFSNEEVKIKFTQQRMTQVWKMSTEELEELHTTIGTYLADG